MFLIASDMTVEFLNFSASYYQSLPRKSLIQITHAHWIEAGLLFSRMSPFTCYVAMLSISQFNQSINRSKNHLIEDETPVLLAKARPAQSAALDTEDLYQKLIYQRKQKVSVLSLTGGFQISYNFYENLQDSLVLFFNAHKFQIC